MFCHSHDDTIDTDIKVLLHKLSLSRAHTFQFYNIVALCRRDGVGIFSENFCPFCTAVQCNDAEAI